MSSQDQYLLSADFTAAFYNTFNHDHMIKALEYYRDNFAAQNKKLQALTNLSEIGCTMLIDDIDPERKNIPHQHRHVITY